MTAGLGRHRAAAAAAFATQGLIFISLTTRLPAIADRWDISALAMSLLLLMVVLLAGLGSVIAENLAARLESAVVLRAGLLTIAAGLLPTLLAPSVPVLIAGLAIFGVGVGLVDASTNMQAVALEHAYGRPLLPSFHGAWTCGGIVGAGIALATAGLPLYRSAGLALIPLLVACAPLQRHGARAAGAPAEVGVPWRTLALVGAAMVLFYTVDVASSTWGPTYLDTTLDSPSRLVALATFPYLVAQGVLRLAGDRLVARHGPVPVLRVGALVACGGLALVVFAPVWPIAVLGFTIVGAGAAVVAPLSFSAAAQIAGGTGLSTEDRLARVDAVIARFNQFNYAGALLGSVLTGVVGAASLRVGFAVPMVLVLAIIPLAAAFRPAPATPVDGAAA